MRKGRYAALIVCALAVCAVGAAVLVGGGRRPYKDLDASHIRAAAVRLTPPDKTVQIAEPKELVEYLSDVVIYDEDNSYTEYDGQGVTFTLTMDDGTRTSIMAYNPFLVIDGVGYRTKYEPCQALNSYANRLLNRKDAVTVLEEPPELSVVSGNTCFDAWLGDYCWERPEADGIYETTIACAAHPLEGDKDLLLRYKFETTEQTATLMFTHAPDRIVEAICWSDELWGDVDAAGESVELNGYEMKLRPGGYIYDIKAEWDAVNGYGGMAHYTVYVEYTPAEGNTDY